MLFVVNQLCDRYNNVFQHILVKTVTDFNKTSYVLQFIFFILFYIMTVTEVSLLINQAVCVFKV